MITVVPEPMLQVRKLISTELPKKGELLTYKSKTQACWGSVGDLLPVYVLYSS